MGQLISTDAQDAASVAIGPVSTANAVGDIAVHLLRTLCKSAGQLATVESSKGHATCRFSKVMTSRQAQRKAWQVLMQTSFGWTIHM